MIRVLCMLIALGVNSLLFSQTAVSTPPRALIEAAGFSAIEPVVAAPAFTLNDHRGAPVALQAHRGKVILINFWATWCPPCIHEMPMMDQLFLSLPGRPFSIWALNVQETQEDVTAFLLSHPFHFPVLLDHDGEVGSRYRVRGLPATYLIDCAGHLIGSITGVLQWTDSAMQKLLEALFHDPACKATNAAKQSILRYRGYEVAAAGQVPELALAGLRQLGEQR